MREREGGRGGWGVGVGWVGWEGGVASVGIAKPQTREECHSGGEAGESESATTNRGPFGDDDDTTK